MDDILALVSRTLATLLPILVFVAVLGFPVWRSVRRRRAEVKRHKDAGTIGPAGPLLAEPLPWHYDKLASLGSGGEAARTLDDRILRPAIGVRLLVCGLAAAAVTFLVRPDLAPDGFHAAMEELPVPLLAVQLFILAAALNGVLYIFGHEARYNRDLLITTRMFLSRREFRWKDLLAIGDDGAYELVLTFAGGGKAKVLKHARGIDAFKRFAQEQLHKNR